MQARTDRMQAFHRNRWREQIVVFRSHEVLVRLSSGNSVAGLSDSPMIANRQLAACDVVQHGRANRISSVQFADENRRNVIKAQRPTPLLENVGPFFRFEFIILRRLLKFRHAASYAADLSIAATGATGVLASAAAVDCLFSLFMSFGLPCWPLPPF